MKTYKVYQQASSCMLPILMSCRKNHNWVSIVCKS